MPMGYWLATYKKIESKDNLGNYAAKATGTNIIRPLKNWLSWFTIAVINRLYWLV